MFLVTESNFILQEVYCTSTQLKFKKNKTKRIPVDTKQTPVLLGEKPYCTL